MPAPADDQLGRFLDGARRGDQAGFTGIYQCLAGRVAGYVRSRRVDDVDGVVNEVFLGAFRNLDRFDGSATEFRSWLFAIAWNKVADAHRAARRVRTASLDALPTEPPGGDGEAEAVAALARDDVTALLDRLTPDQRDVLALRIVADLSLEETAAVLGRPVGAVKSMQHRALASLRRILDAAVSPGPDRTITEVR